MSVLDFFLEVPGEKLPLVSAKTGKPLTQKEMKSLVQKEDAKNGYLSLKPGGAAEGFEGGEVAQFMGADGSVLLVMTLPVGDSTTHILALKMLNGEWTDVTKDVLPALTEEKVNARAQEKIPAFKKENKKLMDSASGTYAYVLPRKGTTIKVVVRSDAYSGPEVVLWEMPFDRKRFKLR
jgi:hypothetical protein